MREDYFVIIRSERRDLFPDLMTGDPATSLKVCEPEGILCGADGKPYRGSTWLLLRIAREDVAQAAKFDNENKVSEFFSALSENAKTIDFTNLNAAVQSLVNSYK